MGFFTKKGALVLTSCGSACPGRTGTGPAAPALSTAPAVSRRQAGALFQLGHRAGTLFQGGKHQSLLSGEGQRAAGVPAFLGTPLPQAIAPTRAGAAHTAQLQLRQAPSNFPAGKPVCSSSWAADWGFRVKAASTASSSGVGGSCPGSARLEALPAPPNPSGGRTAG